MPQAESAEKLLPYILHALGMFTVSTSYLLLSAPGSDNKEIFAHNRKSAATWVPRLMCPLTHCGSQVSGTFLPLWFCCSRGCTGRQVARWPHLGSILREKGAIFSLGRESFEAVRPFQALPPSLLTRAGGADGLQEMGLL